MLMNWRSCHTYLWSTGNKRRTMSRTSAPSPSGHQIEMVCPAHAVPVEVLAMTLAPNWRKNTEMWGIGLENEKKLVAPFAKLAFQESHMPINRSRLSPLKWHRSMGHSLRKNHKAGPAGMRVIHVLDPQGQIFFAAEMARREPAKLFSQCSGLCKAQEERSSHTHTGRVGLETKANGQKLRAE